MLLIEIIAWLHETGGLVLANGVRVATGVEDQNRITSVIANTQTLHRF